MPDYKCLSAPWWPCGQRKEPAVRSPSPEVERCEGASEDMCLLLADMLTSQQTDS